MAELCSQWRLTGEHLQLPEDQLSVIDGDKKSVEEKRIAVLKAKGQDLGGTYLVLVKAFLAMNQAKNALEVCKIFKRSHPSSPHGEGGELT